MNEVRSGESVSEFLRRTRAEHAARTNAGRPEGPKENVRNPKDPTPSGGDLRDRPRGSWQSSVARHSGAAWGAVSRTVSAGARAALLPLDIVSGFTSSSNRALIHAASDEKLLASGNEIREIKDRQGRNIARGAVAGLFGGVGALAFGAYYALQSLSKPLIAGSFGNISSSAAAAVEPTGVGVCLLLVGAAVAFMFANRHGAARLERRVERALQ